MTDVCPRLTTPRVSIIICNHNYARFLTAALESAVGQSHPCEVIVVDDGSTDESRAILEAWSARVKVVLQENSGQRGAYNRGFAESTGEVVLFLDSDDFLDRRAVEKVIENFDQGVAKVHFHLSLVNDHGKRLGGTIPSFLADGDVLLPMLTDGVLYASAPGSGNAYRRSVLEQLMPIPIHGGDAHGADFFLIYGCAAFGRVKAIRKTLASYRVHDKGLVSASLVFGNAAQTAGEPARFLRRVGQFRGWIALRTNGAIRVPERLQDFSISKAIYVTGIYSAPYLQGLGWGARELPVLLRQLWLTRAYSGPIKLGLSGWALAVLVAPRALGRPLARFGSNPASRGKRGDV